MVMKKLTTLWICSCAVIVIALLLSSSCKKDKDNSSPQVPEFTITADTVWLQGGGDGLQFFGKCTNEDVKMNKVIVTSPLSAQTSIFELNGISVDKNTEFSFQDNNVAYYKEVGTWSFTFLGKRASDNESFSVSKTLLISYK